MLFNTAVRRVSVALPLLLAIAHAPASGAQVRPTIRDTTVKRPDAMPAGSGMAGTPGMAAMMAGPHHALAMAYGENLATFAKALNVDASRSNVVNLELANPATMEMRRSFDQMKVHHQAQMSTVGTTMRMPMTKDSTAAMTRPTGTAMRMPMTKDSAAAMTRPARRDSIMPKPTAMPMRTDSMPQMKMGDMQTQMTAIETHLGMLETELKATSPNPAKVIEHTAEILKVCEGMMRMSADPSGGMGRPDPR